jgi:hypothetical protein
MTVMPIAEIINEIDAYLSRLRQAREILLDRMTEAPQKKSSRRKRKVLVRQPEIGSSNGRRAEENKSRSSRPFVHPREEKERGGPAAQASSAESHQTSPAEQSVIVEPGRTLQQSVVITRLPASRRIGSIRSVPHRTAKRAAGTKSDASKPAIALGGPMNNKIVVVPAEQLQEERARAARPQVRPLRRPAAGLGGRLAFEALFKDETDPSKAPAQ